MTGRSGFPFELPPKPCPSCVRLREALTALVKKLDLIAADPQFQSMAVMNYVHGITYTGPNWADEKKAAEALLAPSSTGSEP